MEGTTTSESRHAITRFLAEGGLGKVWLAKNEALNRQVVLKTLQPKSASSAEARKRFLRETQVTGQLEHPNIVPIYDAGINPIDRQPFYTMKFVRGKELHELIQQYHEHRRAGTLGPLELPTLLSLFVGVCHAISFAHHRGVVHRDLKPANVAVGEFGEVMVLDWGIAKLVGQPDDGEEDRSQGKRRDKPAWSSG